MHSVRVLPGQLEAILLARGFQVEREPVRGRASEVPVSAHLFSVLWHGFEEFAELRADELFTEPYKVERVDDNPLHDDSDWLTFEYSRDHRVSGDAVASFRRRIEVAETATDEWAGTDESGVEFWIPPSAAPVYTGSSIVASGPAGTDQIAVFTQVGLWQEVKDAVIASESLAHFIL